MGLVIFNSLGRKKQPFNPINKDHVLMYCCGPTVYDFLHVGNFRGAVFYNFVRNWLEKSGYKVSYVYNFTDVDDKILTRAQKENTTAKDIAERYIKEFWHDFNSLGLKKHSANPRVSDHIQDIIALIETLISRDKAYVVDGEVFFHVHSLPEYGQLSCQSVDDMQAGSRIEIDEKKRHAADFTLWKPAKPGEQSWPSPWSHGRPGWHIECSAMTKALLGDQIDIHGGGMDLIFPHHENEIAQSQGATGKTYVNYWIHNNMFTFDGQKMSKSLGNIRTMRSFLESYHPEVYKFLVLASHYRSTIEFSDKSLHQATAALSRVYSSLAVAESYIEKANDQSPSQVDAQFQAELDTFTSAFQKAADDDFNTGQGIAKLFDLVRTFNQQVKRGMGIKPVLLAKCQAYTTVVKQVGELLALFQQPAAKFLRDLDDLLLEQKQLDRQEIEQMVQKRWKERQSKNFAESDRLREELLAKGIELQDLAEGPYWEVHKG